MKKSELVALRTLAKDVIKKADKGSCIVVEDKDTYIEDALTHLANTDIYSSMQENHTLQLAIAINTYIRTIHSKGFISNMMKDYLTFPDPLRVRTQQLYFIKKIHKGPHEVRPIVSGSSGPTEKISCNH